MKGATWEPGLTAVCHECGAVGDGNFPASWVLGGGVIVCGKCFDTAHPEIVSRKMGLGGRANRQNRCLSVAHPPLRNGA